MTRNTEALAIGKRIRTRMQTANLTVEHAAKLAGLSKATLEEYLYGKSLPGAGALVGLSKGLGCTTDWLLFGDATHG